MANKNIFFITFFLSVLLQASSQELPVWDGTKGVESLSDWLVNPISAKAQIYKSEDGKDIILDNGMLKRTFRTSPNLVCTDYSNLSTGKQLLRSVREEARLVINGKTFLVGGMKSPKEGAYFLNGWADETSSSSAEFKYVSYKVQPIKPQLNWKSNFWTPSHAKAATGKMISFLFQSSSAELRGLEVTIDYELYDGLPLLVKSIHLVNKGSLSLKINTVVSETLAMVEEESAVEGSLDQLKKPQGIYFETNYAFNNSMRYALSDQTTHWKTDSSYTSQVNYQLQTPCVLEIYPNKAPGIFLQPGDSFHSVRTYELLMNSDDREQRGLAVRRMYRIIAPWTNSNPIFMHLVSRDDEQVREAIVQCAQTGYEALILSFGSHLNMEDTSGSNIARWKALAVYAHSRNIRIGGYSLFSSRRISDEDDVIDPKTGRPGGAFFGGSAPCFGSKWGLWYRDNIKRFYSLTGFDLLENDGPYPGDVCASTTHPGHKGLDDSQWRQMEIQKELYHWLNARGVYVNAPDWYFLDGTNKIALGYRETNFSLPREDQKILNRQNIYDGTWEKTPSMSWGFVPLTEYQGGGPTATIEPLSEHIKDYEQLMMEYYGAGIQACYRGPRLYDSEETKQMVIKVITWYKKYREILNSDIIHLRRADGRDWDGILHVNPDLNTKGLLMLYNPTSARITRTLKVPLYYTGLTKLARVKEKEGLAKSYQLARDYTIGLTFSIEAGGYTWFTIE